MSRDRFSTGQPDSRYDSIEVSGMRRTVEIPESILLRTEKIAQTRGLSVDAFISDVLERELGEAPNPADESKRVDFPLIRSKHPGTLDLSGFDFDDLLA